MKTPNNSVKGFILVTVLWFLLILTLIIGFFAAWIQRELLAVQQLQSDFRHQMAYHETRAALLYLLSTQRYTFSGITLAGMDNKERSVSFDDFESNDWLMPIGGEIALDDQAYQGCEEALFSVQDARGLINPNFAAESALMRLLQLFDIPVEEQGPLLAKLQDYMDIDDLIRLNGAERDDYKQQGRPPPTNRFFLTAMEVKKVLDWDRYPQLWQASAWPQLTSTYGFTTPNVNTAPLLVLQAYFGLSAETAQLMIDMRRQQPFIDYTQAINFVEFSSPEEVLLFPSNSVRMTLWHPKANVMQQWHLTLTPFAHELMPWQIHYTHTLPLDSSYAQRDPNLLSHPICATEIQTEKK
jgi:general secretion pathway protein K